MNEDPSGHSAESWFKGTGLNVVAPALFGGYFSKVLGINDFVGLYLTQIIIAGAIGGGNALFGHQTSPGDIAKNIGIGLGVSVFSTAVTSTVLMNDYTPDEVAEMINALETNEDTGGARYIFAKSKGIGNISHLHVIQVNESDEIMYTQYRPGKDSYSWDIGVMPFFTRSGRQAKLQSWLELDEAGEIQNGEAANFKLTPVGRSFNANTFNRLLAKHNMGSEEQFSYAYFAGGENCHTYFRNRFAKYLQQDLADKEALESASRI